MMIETGPRRGHVVERASSFRPTNVSCGREESTVEWWGSPDYLADLACKSKNDGFMMRFAFLQLQENKIRPLRVSPVESPLSRGTTPLQVVMLFRRPRDQ